MNIKAHASLVIMLALVGCKSNQRVLSDSVITKEAAPTVQTNLTEEERARLYDISFPPSIEPFKIAFLETKAIIGYYTLDSLEKVLAYHRADMDYWGWEEQFSCISSEACIVFKKPTKQAVITCRKEQDRTLVTFFIGSLL